MSGWLRVEIVHNSGVSFSRLQGGGWYLIAAVAVVAVGLALAAWRLPARYAVGLAMIVGGDTGNLIDRVRWGYVLDYVSVWRWPTFNIADLAIVAGAFTVAWMVLTAPGEEAAARNSATHA